MALKCEATIFTSIASLVIVSHGKKIIYQNVKKTKKVIAQTYLQPHYGNWVFSNVYLSAGQH